MNNTLENKAKFFALYWGQDVLCSDMYGDNGTIYSATMKESSIKKEWLKLKSLSSISDEDAISVYDITCPNTKWADDYKVKEARSWLNNEFGIGNIHHKWAAMQVADLLRSKGHAIPWMGLSVEKQIEYGWVKLEEHAN